MTNNASSPVPSFLRRPLNRWAALAAAAAIVLVIPATRSALIYNLAPVLLLWYAVNLLLKRMSPRGALLCVIAGALALHAFSFLTQPIHLEPDSHGYIHWGRTLAAGRGFDGMIFRPPLYPFFLGMFFLIDPRALQPIVAAQHLLAIAVVPMVYALGRRCRFTPATSVVASLLVTLSSLSMQMTQQIMTETVFTFLTLGAAFLFAMLLDRPTPARSVAAGFAFALGAHARGVLLPIAFAAAVMVTICKGRRGLRHAAIMLVTTALALVPWSARNAIGFGHFGLSSDSGINVFTKATSFLLLDTSSADFASIQVPYRNVLDDLGLTGYRAPSRPEDAWNVNRIPHVLVDSLVTHHGYTFAHANRTLRSIALTAFMHKPAQYGLSVLKTLGTLLGSHRELYPTVGRVIPLPATTPPVVERFARGLVYAPMWATLLLLLVLAALRCPHSTTWAPPVIVLSGLAATALVQVGFTRYTVPWIPLQALCVAELARHAAGLFRARAREPLRRVGHDTSDGCLDGVTGGISDKTSGGTEPAPPC